jgi:hypothetical protein
MAATTTLPVREKNEAEGESGVKGSGLLKSAKELKKDFLFDQDYVNLNHGKCSQFFGAHFYTLVSIKISSN